MNMKIVALALLLAIAVSAAVVVPSVQSHVETEACNAAVASCGFVSVNNDTGTVPLGDPIDTPGMPT